MSKKILIVNIGTEIGGIEKCLINFLRYLETRDCEVDLALWKPSGPLYDQIPEFVNIIESPGPGSFSQILKEKNPFKLIFRVYKYAKFKAFAKFSVPWKSLKKNKKQYDIAISYCQNGYSPYYVIDNVTAKEKYLWYHELNYLWDDKKKSFDENYFIQFSNIVCVSDACRSNLVKAFPSFSEKFITLYNFYNVDEILKKAIEEDNPFADEKRFILTTVGRLSEEKGVELAIETCKELKEKKSNFVWFWVGDGPMREVAESKISEYKLGNEFVLLGNKTNPYPFIKNCDIYVQPSLSEAYCTTIIEAEVLEKKMVVSDIPSVYEQIKNDSNHYIAQKCPKDFIDGIMNIINNNYGWSEISNLNSTDKYDRLFGLCSTKSIND